MSRRTRGKSAGARLATMQNGFSDPARPRRRVGQGVHARPRGPGALRHRRRLRAAGPGGRDRDLLRQVNDLPRRRRPRLGPAGHHRRPSSRLGGEPARLGVSRPRPGRSGHRAARHAATLQVHPRRHRPGRARDRDRGPVGRRGRAVAHAAGDAVHRRRAHRRRGHCRLRGLGPVGGVRRGAGHPRRVPRPGGRRPGSVPDLPARAALGGVHRDAGGGLAPASWNGPVRGSASPPAAAWPPASRSRRRRRRRASPRPTRARPRRRSPIRRWLRTACRRPG